LRREASDADAPSEVTSEDEISDASSLDEKTSADGSSDTCAPAKDARKLRLRIPMRFDQGCSSGEGSDT